MCTFVCAVHTHVRCSSSQNRNARRFARNCEAVDEGDFLRLEADSTESGRPDTIELLQRVRRTAQRRLLRDD